MRDSLWLEEFAHLLPNDEETKSLVLDGSIEICPCCSELSAYSWDDATSTDDYMPASGTIAHIGVCSGSEWQCGHCGVHLMDRDSPLNHPAFTHEDDR